MRRLFIVLAKIFGLLQLYWALVNFMQVGFAIDMLSRGSIMNEGGQYVAALISTVVYFVLSIGVAWILLIRTEWLADKLRVQEEGDLGEFKESAILRTGVKLIGLYIVAYAIPALVRIVFESGMFVEGVVGARFWTRIIPGTLQLALGIFLAIRADCALGLVAKGEQTESRRVLLVALGILALLIVIGAAVSNLRSGAYGESRGVTRHNLKEDAVFIHKDTNTPDANHWYAKPYGQPFTNSEDILIQTTSQNSARQP